jgi:hypothetical protein
MSMTQLVYASEPFGYDELALAGILASARRNNVRDGITGALICREDLYLQMLEGPTAAVEEIYQRIKFDERHANVITLFKGEIAERLFPNWAMRHDPVQSWMWSADDVAKGAIQRASPEDIARVFQRLASEPPTSPLNCPVAHNS